MWGNVRAHFHRTSVSAMRACPNFVWRENVLHKNQSGQPRTSTYLLPFIHLLLRKTLFTFSTSCSIHFIFFCLLCTSTKNLLTRSWVITLKGFFLASPTKKNTLAILLSPRAQLRLLWSLYIFLSTQNWSARENISCAIHSRRNDDLPSFLFFFS